MDTVHWTDEWMDLQTDRWMDGFTEGQMDGWIYTIQVDGWTDRTLNRLDGREYRTYEYVVLPDLAKSFNN